MWFHLAGTTETSRLSYLPILSSCGYQAKPITGESGGEEGERGVVFDGKNRQRSQRRQLVHLYVIVSLKTYLVFLLDDTVYQTCWSLFFNMLTVLNEAVERQLMDES